MKVVTWTNLDLPEIGYLESEVVMFNDHMTQFDLEEGDLIQHLSDDDETGTYCYLVVGVEPDDEQSDYSNMNLVFAQPLC